MAYLADLPYLAELADKKRNTTIIGFISILTESLKGQRQKNQDSDTGVLQSFETQAIIKEQA